MHYDLVVQGGTVVTMNEGGSILNDGFIGVRDGVIVDVCQRADVAEFRAEIVIDAVGQVITPGLIDAHNHPAHFLSKGLADDLELSRRSFERIWPFELGLTDSEAELGATGTFVEMISSGTTCFADPGSYFPDATARAALNVGIRGIVAREICDVAPSGAPSHVVEDPAVALTDADRVVQEWNGAGDGRLRAMYSLVRPSTVSDDLCRMVRSASQRTGVGIHGHMLTGDRAKPETRLVTGEDGSLARYRRLGLLECPLLLAHLGPLDEWERATLRENAVAAVHCPSASMLGGFGAIAHGNFPELVADGVVVGLGSDAGAISRFLDMVRIAYLAACGPKDARRDPEIMGAQTAFRMATIDGARALGWDDAIGSIAPGKCADLVVFDTSGPEWQPDPLSRPVENLVYSSSGGSARDVVIGGAVVMRDRRIHGVDVDGLYAKAGLAAAEIRRRLGIAQPTAAVGTRD